MDVGRHAERGDAGRRRRRSCQHAGAEHDDAVGLAVAAAAGRGEVDVDVLHLGRPERVDRDDVGAAEGAEVDALDAAGVHRDRGDVAGEAQAAPVGREVDLLADVGAVEPHRVGSGLALDRVAAVAGIPLERVVAGAHRRRVVAAVAVDRVVVIAAEQRLRAGPAAQRVLSVLAVERRRDRVGEDAAAVVDAHEVVAPVGVDDDLDDVRALEAELGRAVVVEVDVERVGLAGL